MCVCVCECLLVFICVHLAAPLGGTILSGRLLPMATLKEAVSRAEIGSGSSLAVLVCVD